MDWSQEETIKFLELFQKEAVLWNPKHISHKNAQKVNDAWTKIANEMGRSIADLKSKKNSLMATFRNHLRRKKESRKSGAGEEDIYKPIWVYYDIMETFLASVYKCDKTMNTEEDNATSPSLFDEELTQDISDENSDSYKEPSTSANYIEHRSPKKSPKKTFRSPVPQQRKRIHANPEADIHKNIKDTVTNLNTMLLNRKENDECDLYAQLLATKLREYSKQERRQIMHVIDGFLLSNPPQHFQINRDSRSTPSPVYSNSSSNSYTPQPLRSPFVPERKTSRKSYVSQPQQSPILLSIPDYTAPTNNPPYSYIISSSPAATSSSHSATTATFTPDTPLQNQITILSEGIINPPHSQNIIDKAYSSALEDEYNTN